MKTWIGSDFHWGHKNIKKFCQKSREKYRDIAHMNEAMVKEWNDIVNPEDTVYMLGDICFMPTQQATETVNRLNGNKILIEGNHDVKLLKDHNFRKCFKEVHQYLRLNYNGQLIVMFHYPIFDHDQAGRGSIMLHGHRHGNPHNIPGRIMDVGMDATNEILVNLDDVVKKMESIQNMYHHGNPSI
jgi:calcineurin-like phosphoesterase family protein